jgi:antitoxin component YwqK of YwqJK toxin-antitoxin module
VSFTLASEKQTGVTSCYSLSANGVLKLQVKNDSIKYICPEIKVINGVLFPCEKNQLINYNFFIKREEIDSRWLVNPIKIYNYFPLPKTIDKQAKWFTFQNNKSNNYREDFTSNEQKTGVTYRHHESKKNFINYVISNSAEKPYLNKNKFQFQYDWEETIKGKFESFYDDGSKRFRHKYVANRFMALDKKVNSKEQQSNCDITLSGVIESFHKTGKKKQLVIYNDLYITEQKINNERVTLKSERTGERKTFYDSGKLFSSGNINFKGYEGEVTYYSSKKNIIKTVNFKDGILEGKFKEFYETGIIKSKGQYSSGKKIGKCQNFDQSGNKSTSSQF